jgi:hypothetical protein
MSIVRLKLPAFKPPAPIEVVMIPPIPSAAATVEVEVRASA